jgi:hypothetical protein
MDARIDFGPGLRYWHLNNQFRLNANLPGDGQSFTDSEDWVDPLIAMRVSVPLSDRWSVTLVGDVGGSGIGSQLTYQAISSFNYQINRSMALRFGDFFLLVNYTQGD